VAGGRLGCQPSWPEGDCGDECADCPGAWRQLPGAGCGLAAEGKDKLAQLLSSAWLSFFFFFFQNRTAQLPTGGEKRVEKKEGGMSIKCQVLSGLIEHFSPNFVYK
jgi:hypothetical protein